MDEMRMSVNLSNPLHQLILSSSNVVPTHEKYRIRKEGVCDFRTPILWKNILYGPYSKKESQNNRTGFFCCDLCDNLFCPELGPDLVGKVFSNLTRMQKIFVDF